LDDYAPIIITLRGTRTCYAGKTGTLDPSGRRGEQFAPRKRFSWPERLL